MPRILALGIFRKQAR